MNKKSILDVIAAYTPITLLDTPLSAAVLILLMQDDQLNFHLIVTKRSEQMDSYAGDYCFPGGMREAGDIDFLNTAQREVEEELNLKQQHYKVIGQLDDFEDRYGNLVRPFVGFITRSDFEKYSKNSLDEIAEIFYFPLSDLLKIEMDERLEKITKRKPSYRYTQNKVTIWGLTASIMVHLGNILFGSHKPLGKKKLNL